MAITEFRELALPDTTVVGDPKWYVRETGVASYYLLNHTNHLGFSNDYPAADFYFSSELEACFAAYRFYRHHGLNYPHMGYLVSLQADHLNMLTKQSSGSKVMEFI